MMETATLKHLNKNAEKLPGPSISNIDSKKPRRCRLGAASTKTRNTIATSPSPGMKSRCFSDDVDVVDVAAVAGFLGRHASIVNGYDSGKVTGCEGPLGRFD